MHASRRTAYERAVIRESRQRSAGTPNRQGGTSFFYRGGNGHAPTPEETKSAVRFANGPELEGHQTFTWGPDFSKIIPGVPVKNVEAGGPSPLRVK
jgi:hypothetical protein